jgi:hypothetical protein
MVWIGKTPALVSAAKNDATGERTADVAITYE